jgi:hypothetical protein
VLSIQFKWLSVHLVFFQLIIWRFKVRTEGFIQFSYFVRQVQRKKQNKTGKLRPLGIKREKR